MEGGGEGGRGEVRVEKVEVCGSGTHLLEGVFARPDFDLVGVREGGGAFLEVGL